MQNHLYLYPNIANVRKGIMTQAELAEQMGISQQEVSRYETGEVKAPINYIIDLASICGVSVDYILGHSTDVSILNQTERELLLKYNSLTEINKARIDERILTLLDIQEKTLP